MQYTALTDDELLLHVDNLPDPDLLVRELASRLREPNDTRVLDLESEVAELESQIRELQAEVAELESEVAELESQIRELQAVVEPDDIAQPPTPNPGANMLTITFQFTDIASAAALLAKLNGHEVAAMVPPSPAPEVAAAPVEKPKATKSTSAATTAAPAPTPRTAEAVADAAPAKTADALASSNAASAEAQPPASTAAAEPFPYAKLQALVFKHLPAHGQVAVLQVAEKHGAAKFKELPANKWRAAHDDLVALFGE